jgi:hypothetical protein
VGPGENVDVVLGAAMAVLPGVGPLSLVWPYAVGVALIVLALRAAKARGP